MKNKQYRAAFFKRSLSMLLVLGLMLGDFGAVSAAAQSDEDETEPVAVSDFAENQIEVAAEPSEEEPVADPMDTQTGDPADTPAGDPTDTPAGDPADTQTGDPTDTPAGDPADTQTGDPADTQTGDPADTQTGDPTDTTTEEPSEGATGGSTAINFSAYQNSDLIIYNYLHYLNENSNVTLSGGSYAVNGTNEKHGIVIGNWQTEAEGTAPIDANIPVSLNGLSMAGTMTIKPVGTGSAYKTVLAVSQPSSLGALVVEDNARLDLELSSSLTVGSITLGQNSVLTVTGSGALTVSGAFTSQGTLALNGGIISAGGGISAGNLSLNGTTIKAGGYAVTAVGTLSMTNSTVENASLFGYTGERGEKTLSFNGSNAFSNVLAVGCTAESAVRVSLEGIESIHSSSGTSYYNDYAITYQAEDKVIEPQSGWPEAYRVSSGQTDFSIAAIRGYHTAESGFTAGTSVPLPTDSMQPGYEHQGWKRDGSEETITKIDLAGGKITLSAVLTAGAVTVKLDRGYDPDQYTNDEDADGKLPERISNIGSKLDETVPLPVPARFGYKFAGWKVTSGTNSRDIPNANNEEIPYQIALADCIIEGEESVVTMEAQWEADTFSLTLFLGSEVGLNDNLEISIDGGNTFQKFRELKINAVPENVDAVSGATANIDFTIEGRNIKFSDKWPITYGDNISEYLRGVFTQLPEGSLPILKDTSAAGTAQHFAGWTTVAGAVDKNTRFLYGENGMLTPGSQTLTEYQQALHENNAAVSAVWGVMSYGLSLPDPMPAGWSLRYTGTNGGNHVIQAGDATSGHIMVQQGSTVTLTTSSVNPGFFSLWSFLTNPGTDDEEKLIPEEQPFNAGDSELLYQFPMPAANVTATYNKGQEIWIDIAKSPILFEENVDHNGKVRKGFWYADLIDKMTPLFHKDQEEKNLNGTMADGTTPTSGAYFYQWDFADKLCVTSRDAATKNQLTLVNELTGGVYLKNVNLEMRDAYVNGTSGNLLAGVDCESSQNNGGISSENVKNNLTDVDLADYANIVIDISKHSAYTTTLHFVGNENTVGAIMQDTLQISNISPLKLEGDGEAGSAVKLGAAFGYFRYIISGITVREYTKENADFNYLLYCAHQSGFHVTNAVIQAPNKKLHAGFLSKAEEEVFFRNSKVELYSICVFKGVQVIGSSLRVHENARFGHIPLRLAENAKVVIDGNLEMNYHHWADTGALTDNSPDNWLIVKGTFCDISNRIWKSGTLICNNLVLGRTGGIQGGTVITNQITNQAVGFWHYDKANHTYTYDPYRYSQAKKADQNNDNYPFLVYHHGAAEMNTYTFSGGNIYLLGYYRATGRVYDSSMKATEGDNPVAQFMNPLLDGNGNLKPNPAVSTAAVQTAVKNSTLTSNECVVLGNSSYNGQRRSVEISGGEIYAAGNITFYNDTTVSGGNVYCNGSFGSKGDLTVTGGSVTATAVGNAYNLTTTLEDGTLCWKRTDIQGGTVTATARIGAFEKRVSDTETPAEAEQPKGTVTIGTGATIVGTPEICHDVYINYILDPAMFSYDETQNKNTLRFETNWKQGEPFENQIWENTALTFAPPDVLAEPGGTGSWNWDSLTGKAVEEISEKGILQSAGNELSGEKSAYDRIQMKLYAVKDSYDLIFKAGASEITSVTCDGEEVQKAEANGKITAPATANKEVVLTFADPTMAQDYSVLWYIDGSGIIHSVNPKAEGNAVCFTMPNSDVEVYAAKELSLDLDIASYTLLQDGFRTEANATPKREDSKFRYLGNLVIHQGCITGNITFNIDNFTTEQMISPGSGKQTTNKILVDNLFDSSTNGRTVTLRQIYQDGTPTSHGIDLEAGAKASFLLDGAIRICRVRVPSGSDFTLKGKNNDRTKDAIYPTVKGQAGKDDWASIGDFDGPAGNITLKDLTILGREDGLSGSLGYSKNFCENTVQYINCVYQTALDGRNTRGWHDRGFFAHSFKNVIFDGCKFKIRVSRDWPGFFFDGSENITIRNNSTITVSHNGAYDNNPASTIYAKVGTSFVIENSTLDLSLRVPGGDDSENDGRTYRVHLNADSIPPIELKGNATLILEQHARLNKLVIGGTSTVKAGQTGTGYLLCQDIQVNDSAKLEAGGIIVSGFYDAKKSPAELETESDFQKAMAAGQYIHNGMDCPGLVVKGGTVTAKEYITGDVNGKITVSGGTVTAPKIGTTGKLYGYTRYVPRAGEKYIYTYEKIPMGMDINISGGTVDVTDYLGGMKADVSISGGEVRLGENAVLGLTDGQRDTLYNHFTANKLTPENFGSLTMTGGKVEGAINEGAKKGGSIQMPYGTVNVSGETAGVHVYNMTAHSGEMEITGATGKIYDNPYTGSGILENQNKLAVCVNNLMSARRLTITKGSVVYASYAYANVPQNETGQIVVTIEGDDRAYLYTGNAYGIIGDGNGSYSYNDGTPGSQGDKNVFGKKVVDVHYIIQPEDVFLTKDIGKETNPNLDALPYYVVTDSKEYYDLQDASCSGYEFLGWYEYDPIKKTLGNDRVYKIDKSNSADVYLGAKWKKVRVTFEIRIEVEASEETAGMTYVGPGENGKNLYKFNRQASIDYGDPILTVEGIHLPNYTTKTQGINAISYEGVPIGKEQLGESIPNTRVTAEMADAFQKNPDTPLILMVPDSSKTTLNTLIYLNQNKSDKGRPLDTRFNCVGKPQIGSDTGDQIGEYGHITSTLGSIKQFADAGQADGLIHPTAPGYTFGGWYTTKDCTSSSKVTATTSLNELNSNKTTTLYAQWTPNTYLIQFSAATKQDETIPAEDHRWVTVDDTTPPAWDDPTTGAINYHWIYDTAPSAGQCFWVKGADGSKQYQRALPSAWREGHVFWYWQFTDSKGTEHRITNQDELRQEIANLQVENYVGSPAGDAPALTLYAKYRPVKVSYNSNGGVWTGGNAPSTDPVYGEALAGYRKVSDIPGAILPDTYEKLGTATGEDGTEYFVVSTTSSYFADNEDYVPGDYREALSKKGYTFRGWKDAEGAYCGCTPRFEDISLTAEWEPNIYDLKLHVKDEDYRSYVSAFNDLVPSTRTIKNVTVGSPIPADGQWPEKTEWYAYNPDEDSDDKHRFLLGVSFAALDPGNSNDTGTGSVYIRYAAAVTKLLNSKTLFDKGNAFFLPEDDVYGAALTGAVVTKTQKPWVPDYPTGSEIPMYGVYRERSLVFIETYVDSNGTQSRVLCSHPWSQYTSYPYDTYPGDSNGRYNSLLNDGYALVGWYVHSSDIDPAREYTKTNFDLHMDEWRNDSTQINSYDINVYTAYVAQKTTTQALTAKDKPTLTELPSASYTLPGSMQEGTLSYQISGLEGLNLVTKAEMQEHPYASRWTSADGKDCTADNTVAIELNLTKDKASYSVSLLEAADKQKIGDPQTFGKDWKFTLTLYHSKVMTQEEKNYSFTIEYTFEKNGSGEQNTLKDQWLKENVTVTLKPSRYQVEYRAMLPETADKLTVLDNKDFAAAEGESFYRHTVEQGYGSDLLPADQTLRLEGYDRETNWRYPNTTDAVSLTKLTLDGVSVSLKETELADGIIPVYTGYEPKKYRLENKAPKDAWTITYGNGAGDNTATELLDSTDVKYHSLVTFTPKGSQRAEYITLTLRDENDNETKVRLDQYAAKQGNTYTFAMPAKAVTVSYSDVMDLYLDNGTIELYEGEFIQHKPSGNERVSWPGNYRILQCENNNTDFHSTANVLKLSKNLAKRSDGTNAARTVSLGNLNISSDNSIELRDGCTVNLTQEGNIAAQNILVPQGTSLILTGAYDGSNADQSKTITLKPKTDRAAIGAAENAPENGSITLQNVDVSMALNAPSVASGIGPGKQDGTKSYGAVAITASKITVTEKANISNQYSGTWIGGAGAASVTMDDTSLINGSGSDNHGAKAVDGNTVSLTNCRIGEGENPVKEAIHAATALNINSCKIYQENDYKLGSVSMIGTDGGTTRVTTSTVQIDYGVHGDADELFTGQLLIEDAKSDITIDGTQILEVSKGSITIEESGVTQGSEKHLHSSLNYLLLEEGELPAAAPNLIVEGLGENKTITVQQPRDANKKVTIGKLDIKDDAKLILNGDLIVTDASSVAEAQTLAVEGKDNHSVSYEKGLTGAGSYSQTGGSLNAKADVVVKGNMTLTHVTAACEGKAIGSSGGSDTTAATVTINGGSVTAATVGACGEQNKTFTFVKMENAPVIEGKLVQDHYRLDYKTGSLNVSLTDLPTVLRTETLYTDGSAGAVTVHDGKPANPTEGSDVAQFRCWFIWDKNGTERLGLLNDTDELFSGLSGRTLLAKDTESKHMSVPAADGTQTLSVYPWLNAKGTAKITSGRLFETFSNGDKTASVSNRGAWTAMLESNASYITGRDYQATFTQALPAGTDLTLAVLTGDGSGYYHYTLKAGADKVKFSEFTKMGTTEGAPPAFASGEASTETFLLSADFGELADGAVPPSGNVSFSVLLEDGTPINLGEFAKVDYTVTGVAIGALTADADANTVTVQTQPSGEERRRDKTVYLVGTLSKDAQPVKVPLNASASLTAGTEISGRWLSGDTVAFALGSYGNLTGGTTYPFAFEALPEGTYSIKWRLCTGEALNMLNGVCSGEVTSTMSVAVRPQPMLQLTSAAESHVLAVGTEGHTLSFAYETNASSFTVTVEKQRILANFDPIEATSSTVTTSLAPDTGTASGTVSAEIPAEAGTYRVCFSIEESSRNDDVYYTFIVE